MLENLGTAKTCVDRAVEKYDFFYLMNLAREECEEFSLAVSHLTRQDRKEPFNDRMDNMIEEMVDAILTLICLSQKFDNIEALLGVLDKKANRWMQRMDEDEGNASE